MRKVLDFNPIKAHTVNMSKRKGRPPIMTKCGWCHGKFSLTQLRWHVVGCPKRPRVER